MGRDSRIPKEGEAEVKLVIRYNSGAHDKDSIRKYLENLSSPLLTIVVTRIKDKQ